MDGISLINLEVKNFPSLSKIYKVLNIKQKTIPSSSWENCVKKG